MVRFTQQQRTMFAEKFIDFAHLASGALVIGQIVSGQNLSLFFVMSGVVILILGYIISYVLTKRS